MFRESLLNFLPRAETITAIKEKKVIDIAVIGGGIHGAACARLSALNGFSTVLLERNDYGGATSSRSSKMAHGGLRYLESFDFQQVFEGVKAREQFLKVANHITTPTDFLMPIKKSEWFFKTKLNLGLTLYDLFIKDRSRKHRWIDSSTELMDLFGKHREIYQGGYIYSDAIVNDSRLVLDTILAAREEGALALNYADVERITPLRNGRVSIAWKDNLSGKSYEFDCGAVINCCGPWAHEVGQLKGIRSLKRRIRYSQGSHILFDHKWQGPALILPMSEPGRYYFVWPHFGGTMVGTTERELSSASIDPLPYPDEIEEIYNRLNKDLPELGLTPDKAYYCFAGIRTLPISNTKFNKDTSKISRKHHWFFDQGVLTLIGGKLTTAYWTALEGLRIIVKMAELDNQVVSAKDRPLPGAMGSMRELNDFRQKGVAVGASKALIEGAIRRFGSRVNYFLAEDDDSWFESIAEVCFKGELELALDTEQAETLEDLMRRRLGLELCPGHGLSGLDQISEFLKTKRPNLNIDLEKERYCSNIDSIHSLLKGNSS